MVEIRRLQPDDRTAWEGLFKAYIEFYQAAVPQEVVDLTWRRVMAGPPDGFLGLAAVDATGKPVGIAHVVFHVSTWSPTCYCYLEDLFVAPQVRRGGIGRALIEAVYAAADEHGATRTYWTTQDANFAARALYDTLATRTYFIQYRREA